LKDHPPLHEEHLRSLPVSFPIIFPDTVLSDPALNIAVLLPD